MAETPAGPVAGPQVMRLRYRGVCEACGAELPAGITAVYDRPRRKVRCVECRPSTDEIGAPPDAAGPVGTEEVSRAGSGPAVPSGTAGGSAMRVYQRRSSRVRARQEAEVAADRAWRARAKAEHPVLGRIASAVTPRQELGPEPRHVTAWKTGAEGEQRLGRRLDDWAAAGGGVVLHDRRKPGSQANIDHVAVARSGVYVIDAKRYGGKVEAVDVGGWFSTDVRLKVRGRDRTKLTAGVADQVAVVRSVLAQVWPDPARPAVQGMLCFIDSQWAWLAKPFQVNDVMVAWPAAAVEILDRPGPWDPAVVARIGTALASTLPPA